MPSLWRGVSRSGGLVYAFDARVRGWIEARLAGKLAAKPESQRVVGFRAVITRASLCKQHDKRKRDEFAHAGKQGLCGRGLAAAAGVSSRGGKAGFRRVSSWQISERRCKDANDWVLEIAVASKDTGGLQPKLGRCKLEDNASGAYRVDFRLRGLKYGANREKYGAALADKIAEAMKSMGRDGTLAALVDERLVHLRRRERASFTLWRWRQAWRFRKR